MTPAKHRLPGEWLLRIARDLFDSAIVSGVLEPTIADLQEEFVAARSGADRMLARWRGYVAFWSIVIMAPITLRQWPGHRRRARAYLGWAAVSGVVIVLVVAWRPIMLEFGYWLFETHNVLRVAAAIGGFAFLAGPLALTFVGVRRWAGGRQLFRVGAAEAMLFSLLSVTAGVTLGAAGMVYTFSEIGVKGTAGLVPVVNGVTGAIRPVLYALVTFGVCVAAIAVMTLRARRGGRPDDASQGPPTPSTGTAVTCAVLLCLVVVAVDRLLQLNHQTMGWLVVLISPPRPGSSARITAEGFSESVSLLLFWGLVLTIAVFAAGLYVWRASRARVTHPLMIWTARVALVVVFAGAAWHGRVLNGDLRHFLQLVESQRRPAG